MIIPIANSIRFRKVDSNYTNIENTLMKNQAGFNRLYYQYCQRFLTTETRKIQIRATSDTLPTVTAYHADNTTTAITPTGSAYVSRYDTTGDGNYDLWFFEFDVLMSSFLTSTYITAVQDGETWISEQFKGDADLLTELNAGEAIQIEYYNFDNAFLMDYSTGIVGVFYIGGYIPDFEVGGEFSVFDNQTEKTILKSSAFKIAKFVSESVPIWIYELLSIASRMDNFTVNGISYITEDAPEIKQQGQTNLYELTLSLTDKEYLGVNSDDTGFDIESIIETEGMSNLQQLAQSGNIQFDIPAGWQVHTFTALKTAGVTGSVKAGTTIGAQDIVYPLTLADANPATVSLHFDKSMSAASVLYVNISGAGVTADIYIMLLRNIQAT